MRIINIIILLFILNANCAESFNINGSWYCIINDTYTEIYINDSLITECTDDIMGLSRTYNYYLKNDTIFVHGINNETNAIPVRWIDNKNIELFRNQQWIHCYRLLNVKNVYSIKENDENSYNEFLYNFKLRAQRKKHMSNAK